MVPEAMKAADELAKDGIDAAVAEVLSEKRPTIMKRIGVNDEVGEVGEVGNLAYLRERFGLTASNIVEQAKTLLSR